MQENCIFCRIISGEIDCAKIWEDDNYMAILDINPNMKGQTLVFPKKHYNSDIFKQDEKEYLDILVAARKVAAILTKKLGVKRVSMVAEGMGVNHLHIKLYPMHGLQNDFQEMWAKDRIYFEKYEGYLSTQLGPQVSVDELKTFAKEISDF